MVSRGSEGLNNLVSGDQGQCGLHPAELLHQFCLITESQVVAFVSIVHTSLIDSRPKLPEHQNQKAGAEKTDRYVKRDLLHEPRSFADRRCDPSTVAAQCQDERVSWTTGRQISIAGFQPSGNPMVAGE